MKLAGIVKKVIGAVILAAEIVMAWQTSGMLSLEFLPVWDAWSKTLTLGIFAVLSVVSVVVYLSASSWPTRSTPLRDGYRSCSCLQSSCTS